MKNGYLDYGNILIKIILFRYYRKNRTKWKPERLNKMSANLFKKLSFAQLKGMISSSNSHEKEMTNIWMILTFGKNAKIPYSMKCMMLYRFTGSSKGVLNKLSYLQNPICIILSIINSFPKTILPFYDKKPCIATIKIDFHYAF